MKTHRKKLLSLLLALSMIFSLLPGAMLTAGADEVSAGTTYVKADTIVSGGKYIIACVDGNTAHCLDADELPTGSGSTAVDAVDLDVDTDNNTITTDDASLIWTFEASSAAWYIRPGDSSSSSLYLGGGSAIYIATSSQRALTYSSGIISYAGSSTYRLKYNTTDGTFSNSTSSGSQIVFFEETEGTGTASLGDASVAVGDSVELTLTLSSSLEGLPVTWESDDVDVATVDDGVVTGVSAGTVTVTATVEGISATCTVTVIQPMDYIRVSDFEGPGDYIIAYVEGDTAHCLDYDELSTTTTITSADATNAAVSDDVISTFDESLAWSVTASGDDWCVMPAGGSYLARYLYLTYQSSTGRIYLNTTSRAYAYDPDTGYLTYYSSTNGTYHLTYSGGSFVNDLEAQTGSDISLFKKIVSPTDISVDNATVGVGETVQLTAEVTPEDAIYDLTWAVTAGISCAAVDEDGVVMGLAAGTATVTASIDGTALSDSCTVTVVGPTTYVRVSSFEAGEEYILAYVEGATAHCLDYDELTTSSSSTSADATDAAVSDDVISTFDESLAWTVTSNDDDWLVMPAGGGNSDRYLYLTSGKIYLNTTLRAYEYGSGTGYLTYYSSNSSSTYYLTFADGTFTNETTAQAGSAISLFKKAAMPTGISVNDATVEVGDTVTLAPVVTPEDAAYTLTWAVTAGGSYAEVNASGVVTGLAAGTATVTVTINGTSVSDTCTVTVTGTPVLPTGISVADATVEVGETVTLTPVVTPEGAAYSLTWAVTAGASYAEVNASGVVTGVAAGTATVTATINGTSLSDTCTVTVTAQPTGEEAFIGFTSDVHASISNLENWLTHVPADLDHMVYGGDYSYTTSGSSAYIADFAEVVDLTNTYVGEGLGVYTSGNHEYQTTTLPSGLTDLGLLRIGEGVNEDNYIIYCMGASSGSATGNYPDADIETLRTYLETAPDDIPIFITAHFPLHYISTRTTTNADDMIALLNEHPNTVFLWGHNHSQGSAETHYGEILTAGDTVTYSSGHSSEINFTYACAGAMYSTQQSPYYGLVADVSANGHSVSFSYYNLSGAVANLKNTGLASLTVPIGDSESDNANLTSLAYSLNGGVTYTAISGFSASTVNYDVTLPYGTADGLVSLQGVCSDGDALVTANAGAMLLGGAATASITVTAEDGTTTKSYTVNFTVMTSQGTEYMLTDSFVDGGKYLIAYVSGSTASCLDVDTVPKSSSTATSAATAQTVSENTITTSDTTVVWTATKSGDDWLLSPANGDYIGYSLYMGNGPRMYLATAGRAMDYSGGILYYVSSSSTYYLTCSGGSFAANTSAGSAISIFAEHVAATSISIPETTFVKVGRTVQLAATLSPTGATSPVSWSAASGSEYVSVDQTGLVTGLQAGTGVVVAAANGHSDSCIVTVTAWPSTGSSFLGFTSDTHFETGATNNLDNWLTDVSALYPSIDYMGICGDIASTSSTSVTQYWQFVQAMIDTVDDHDDFVTDGGIYTTGNHEMYAGPAAGGNYNSVKTTNNTAMLISQTGVAAANEDYIIYTFGSCNSVTSSTVQEFTQAQIAALDTYLDSAPDDIPIFIMSHYPLHYDGNRVAQRSEDVIAILNEHPNAIFLWGHNHSDAGTYENGYDNILKTGAVLTTLNVDSGTSKQTTIQFTYAPAGCMSDEEYDDGSAAVLGKGLIAEIAGITDGKRVTLTYYGINGQPISVTGKTTSTSVDILEGPGSYTISWDTDGDGDVDGTTSVAYGTTPTHADGSKAADAQYTYTFTGWSPTLAAVTGEATYTATFTTNLRSYGIGWDTDGDGEVDGTTSVAYGSMPTRADGSKAADAQYTYTFTGWSPVPAAVTGETTYTATFTSNLRSYDIGWDTDGDGDVDKTTSVAYGTTPTHADGSKAADAKYTYTFTGWSPAPAAVTGEATYTAQFDSTVRSYAIGWDTDGDGDVDETTTVAYGTTPTHADGSKAADAQYTYTFTGWSPVPAAVTGEATYTATFTTNLRSYGIGWDTDGDGDVDGTTSVAYGSMPTRADGSKAADAQYTYTFIGWSPTFAAVTGETTYTATFTSNLRSYDIGWDTDGDGDVDGTTSVAYGTTPTHADGSKAADSQYTYTFTGWSPVPAAVTGETTYTATFTTNLRSYDIGWDTDGDGDVDGTTSVAYGTTPTHADGSKAADAQYTYTFTGWSPVPAAVTGETTYTAQFTRKAKVVGGGGGGGSITILEPEVPMASAGELPYYLEDGSEQKIFIGFAYDLNADAIITEGEYLAPAGKEILFAANVKVFEDVSTGWAAPYIAFVADREIFTGTSETKFSPEDGMTRAMFVTVIGRLYERSYGMIQVREAHSFTVAGDCDYTAYYGKYVDWAVANGIITGYEDGTFHPDGMITRQEMAVIISRFANFLEEDVACSTTPGFTDNAGIAAWAENSVAYCGMEGIITGRTDGSFDPLNTATRQDVAAIITRFIKMFMA